MKALAEKFYDATARIEEMFLLAGVLGDVSLPQPVEDFFTDEDFKTIEECFGEIPAHVKEDVEAHDTEALLEWLVNTGKFGFLVRMATPIMTPVGKSGGSYSWGYYTTKWFYGETLEIALEAGFSWVAAQREKERMKAQGNPA